MGDSRYLDNHQPIYVIEGVHLPHWHQAGKLQFVTMHLADSLPLEAVNRLKAQQEEYARTHPQPWDAETTRLYKSVIPRGIHRLLDAGFGECVLRSRGAREEILRALRHHHGTTCRIDAFVIMPNHMHILLELMPEAPLDSIVNSIKRYTSRKIGHGGRRLWMRDYFDRMVRDAVHYDSCRRYIAANPCHLSEEEYSLYLGGS